MAEFPKIAGYQIHSLLGKSGLSNVYFATQKTLGRNVAIKIFKTSLLKKPNIAQKFEKKAKAASRLSHSHIAQVFDTGNIGGQYYIIMEYLDESLADWLLRNPNGKMQAHLALNITGIMMDALDYAHSTEIIHRNIKPPNIMFRQDSSPMLVDFSFARVFDSSEHSPGRTIPIETARYMSPEELEGFDVDGRTDIYSLGAVLYEMLTGQKPFSECKTIPGLLQKKKESPPLLPEADGLKKYQPLIRHMMAGSRENRIYCSAQFHHLLNHINAGAPNPSLIDFLPPPASGESHHPGHAHRGKTPIVNKYFYFIDNKIRAFIANTLQPTLSNLGEKTRRFIKEELHPRINRTLELFKGYSTTKKLLITLSPIVLTTLILVLTSITKPTPHTKLDPNHPIARLMKEISYRVSLRGIVESYDQTIYSETDTERLLEVLKFIRKLKRTHPHLELKELERKVIKQYNDITYRL